MTIKSEITNSIAELVMDNPPVNALNNSDAYELAQILDSYREKADVNAVILTAEGKGFCAGVDIKEIQASSGNEGILGAIDSFFQLFRSIY